MFSITLGKNRQLALNMIANFFNLAISLVIGFFLTPYVIKEISGEAYGYVGLSNSIIGYASIVTIALNSVAGRFITISFHAKKPEEAATYFSSVFISNVIIGLLLIPVAILFVTQIDRVINVPQVLLTDVRILFAIVFVNFLFSIIGTVYTVSTYITNTLYISNIIGAISNVIKVLLYAVFFSLFTANIIYVGLGTLISTLFLFGSNIYLTRKLVPTLKISKRHFSISKIKELVFSGSWNVLSKLSLILSDGLDLLLTNIWIDAYSMGQYAIAKTIQMIMSTYITSISNIFAPQLTLLFAKNDIENLIKEIRLNMKISSFFSNLPFCFIVIFGDIFCSLWVPNQNVQMIHILTILSIQAVLISGAVSVLYNVFLITNKLKIPSLYWFVISVLDITIVSILLQYTNWGVYVIAGVSTTVGIISLLTFIPMYACKCLAIKRNTFHPYLFRYVFVTLFILGVLLLLRYIVIYEVSWTWLLFFFISSVFIGGIINYLLLFDKGEKDKFSYLIKSKLMIR